ncbi:MAG: hypothetical protein ACO1OO_03570 [Flavisolibacter sp.]
MELYSTDRPQAGNKKLWVSREGKPVQRHLKIAILHFGGCRVKFLTIKYLFSSGFLPPFLLLLPIALFGTTPVLSSSPGVCFSGMMRRVNLGFFVIETGNTLWHYHNY